MLVTLRLPTDSTKTVRDEGGSLSCVAQVDSTEILRQIASQVFGPGSNTTGTGSSFEREGKWRSFMLLLESEAQMRQAEDKGFDMGLHDGALRMRTRMVRIVREIADAVHTEAVDERRKASRLGDMTAAVLEYAAWRAEKIADSLEHVELVKRGEGA